MKAPSNVVRRRVVVERPERGTQRVVHAPRRAHRGDSGVRSPAPLLGADTDALPAEIKEAAPVGASGVGGGFR